jgi:hypothetical protein
MRERWKAFLLRRKNRGPNENKGDKFPFAARGEGTGALQKITKTY